MTHRLVIDFSSFPVENCPYSEFFGPYFLTLGMNVDRCEVSFSIQSECGKYGPEKLQIWTLFICDFICM